MKRTQQLEAEILAAEKASADHLAASSAARSLPFYGSGKAQRIASSGIASTQALALAYDLRGQLPEDHPQYLEPSWRPVRWARRRAA